MRKNMVTRTVTTLVFKGFVMNEETLEVKVRRIESTDDMTEKAIIKQYNEEHPGFTLVKLTDREEHEQLYGMLESDFIRFATPMDSRFQKI